jgi:hypothetical protein
MGMAARLRKSAAKKSSDNLVDLASAADQRFLRKVIDNLERLRAASDSRGHPFLSSLLDIARREAADDLKTQRKVAKLNSSFSGAKAAGSPEDENLRRIAEKLAHRR